ncbi:MAG: hypothetical protein ACM3O8_07900 [Methylococcaceae bacterium]|nr:hypothetical protein [Prolixibacteraceae bacterium]
MKITRDNYESFFLDYLEGNLEETMIDQFLDFLKQNPDLKEELDLFENVPLPKEQVVFQDKQSLYISAGQGNESFDHRAVAYMEGDLDEKERKAFEATLSDHLKYKKEYALFEKTRLTPDLEIQFAQKEKLYKKSATILWINWMGRAAAILILLWGISALFQTGEDTKLPAGTEKLATVKEPAIEVRSGSLPKATEPGVNKPAGQPTGPMTKVGHADYHRKANVKVLNDLQPSDTGSYQREASALEQIAVLPARIQENGTETVMALRPVNASNNQKRNQMPAVMTLDEYLALKAKKATNGGLLSANRLLRVGLNVASEISGERLGYTVKNGKVASLDFESKLLAFEIPLEKKN